MMQSISHWGQFEMQAAGLAQFKERVCKEVLARLSASEAEQRRAKPTSLGIPPGTTKQ